MFISKQFSEVKLVERVFNEWTKQVYLFENCLALHHFHAVLDEFGAVEKVVRYCERVVIELSIVDQITHQRFHHIGLPLHVLELTCN